MKEHAYVKVKEQLHKREFQLATTLGKVAALETKIDKFKRSFWYKMYRLFNKV